MRARAGMLVVASAVVLGASTGLFLLPDPGAARTSPSATPIPSVPATSPPMSTSTHGLTPTPSPTATPTPSRSGRPTGSGPVTEKNLVPVRAFGRAGLTVKIYPQNGNTAPTSSLTECTDDRKTGARTLADLTGRDPVVMGTWDEPSTTDTALEVVTVAESPELAEVYARRIVAAQTICQDEPKGHFVYGPVHTEDVATGTSARWLGRWGEKENKTGRAPDGSEPCGGVIVAANGTHLAVLEVLMCADDQALATLAVAAAEQLG